MVTYFMELIRYLFFFYQLPSNRKYHWNLLPIQERTDITKRGLLLFEGLELQNSKSQNNIK